VTGALSTDQPDFLTIAISGERKTSADRAFNKSAREWMVRRREALQPTADRANAKLAAWAAEREGLRRRSSAMPGKRRQPPRKIWRRSGNDLSSWSRRGHRK